MAKATEHLLEAQVSFWRARIDSWRARRRPAPVDNWPVLVPVRRRWTWCWWRR